MASEPKDDSFHFLVLTDVCGNRTYGAVAQYYRPLHVGGAAPSPCCPAGGVSGPSRFTDENVVAQRGQATCLRSHSGQD